MQDTRDLPVYFVTGLPRSGSTVLMNLLAQHPDFAVTPTSGLVDMVFNLRKAWPHNISFKSELQASSLEDFSPKIRSMLRGVISGYHEEQFLAGKTVFNKSRGWIAYLDLLEDIFERPMKMIVTVRDIRAILASFEKIHRKEPLLKHIPDGAPYLESQDTVGRCRQLLSPGGVVGISISRLRDALQRGYSDRMIIVPFQSLTHFTVPVLESVHDALEIERYDYDPDHVEQVTHEDDTVHGMELHKIRSQVRPMDGIPWRGILPDAFAEAVGKEYSDIHAACAQVDNWFFQTYGEKTAPRNPFLKPGDPDLKRRKKPADDKKKSKK